MFQDFEVLVLRGDHFQAVVQFHRREFYRRQHSPLMSSRIADNIIKFLSLATFETLSGSWIWTKIPTVFLRIGKILAFAKEKASAALRDTEMLITAT